MSTRLRLLVLLWLFGLCVVFLYNDWFWAWYLNPNMPVAWSLISELSARTQPYAWAFRSMDVAAGVLSLAAVPFVWRFIYATRRHNWGWLLPTVFAAIGIDSIVDALLPISCSPSLNRSCNLAATHSLMTNAHLAESTIIGIITFVAPFLWWRWHHQRHTLLAQASLWFAVSQVVVGAGIVLSRFVGWNDVGLWQRFYELTISLWMVTVMIVAIAWRRPEVVLAPVEPGETSNALV